MMEDAINYNGKAKLKNTSTSTVIELESEVWLPQLPGGKVFIKCNGAIDTPYSISPEDQYEFLLEIFDSNGNKIREIYIQDFTFDSVRIRYDKVRELHIANITSSPFSAVVISRNGRNAENNSKRIQINLTENQILSPMMIHENTDKGDIKTTRINNIESEVQNLGNIFFDRHFNFTNNQDGSLNRYGYLVGLLELEMDAGSKVKEIEAIKNRLDDHLLLYSLAAGHRINISKLTIYEREHDLEIYYSRIVSDRHEFETLEPVIDKSIVRDFIQTTALSFHGLESHDKKLLRQAIYAAIPYKNETLEASILGLFSGLESMIMVFRKKKNYEYTVRKNKWKKLEEQLKKVIDDSDSFESPTHRNMLRNMLPLLRRVPLKDAYNALLKEHDIPTEDLWPLFCDTNNEMSLYDIRNHLSHGNSFDDRLISQLSSARGNLEILLKRTILVFLAWEVDKSLISQGKLNSWTANKDIRGDMLKLKENSTHRT